MRTALLMLAALICAAAAADEDDVKRPTVAALAEVRLARLEIGIVKPSIEGYGTVLPDANALTSISFNKAGQVARIMVRPGQPVKKGDPIVLFETDPQNRADYLKAESAVTFARGELDRTRALLAQHLVTNSQMASAEQALRDAEATLDAARANGAGIGSSTLQAPFDGYIDSLLVTLGDRIQPGAAIARLGRGAGIKAVIGIEPSEAGAVAAGMEAQVSPLVGEVKPLSGKVAAVGGMVDPQTRMVSVTIAFDQAGLMPGNAVRAALQGEGHKGYVVPRSAVLRDEDGVFLYQVKDNKAIRVEVETGVETDKTTEVSGERLDPALPVVTLGNYELQDGTAVKAEGTR